VGKERQKGTGAADSYDIGRKSQLWNWAAGGTVSRIWLSDRV
jgi:hypothetical protein